MSFSLTGEYGVECIEGVGVFTYLGWPLEKSDGDLPGVRRNIRKTRKIWGKIGKLLRREGTEPLVWVIFKEQWSMQLCSLGQKHG